MKLWALFIVVLIADEISAKCRKCFPDNFFWGTATSAYQIEGAWNTSGKSESIWDWFTHNYPDKIADGSNGDIAADSYNQYEVDVELLANLGVKFYRFSLAWTRILPDSTTNNINQEGVEYYLNLIQALKSNNIEPVVTLYHWDLPLLMHQLGGWTNPEIVDFFVDYANVCFTYFGPYVKYWITLNEPITQCYFGYGAGTYAPGIAQSGTSTYICAYTQLLAHAKTYRSYNNTFKEEQNGQVGITLVNYWYEPLNSTDEADIEAVEIAAQFGLGLFANPIFNGNWPQVIIDRIGNLSVKQGFIQSRLPEFSDEEQALLKGTHDFLGLNYYTTYQAFPIEKEVLEAVENTTISYVIDRGVNSSFIPNTNQSPTATWLFDVPRGIREMLNWVANQYGNPPILITENGWADDLEGNNVNDTDRITYIKGHLCHLLQAIYLDGINVFGYTHWSLLDNFEWIDGYENRFGIVGVDFDDENRTRSPKQSYYYYRDIVTSNCLEHCGFKRNT